MNRSKLATTVQLINSGKTFPVIGLTKENPAIAAAISKLVTPRENHSTHDNKGNRTINTASIQGFGQVSREISNRVKDFKAMMELFPETELAAQILVSCVISPKDMTRGDINIIASDGLRSVKLTGLMLDAVKEYFDKTYKIKPLLPKILRSVLIEQGSDPHLVLPENSIDDLINGSSKISFENLSEHIDRESGTFKSYGILGNSEVTTTEKSNYLKYIQEALNPTKPIKYNPQVIFNNAGKQILAPLYVIDNPSVLQMPKIVQKNSTFRTIEQYQTNNKKNGAIYATYASESFNKNNRFSDVELSSLLYKNKHKGHLPFQKVRGDDEMQRMTVGAPLVMRLPPDAVIPVHTPGNEENHIGYFILIDSDGNPITAATNSQYLNDMGNSLQSNGDMNTYLMAQSKNAMNGSDCKFMDVRQATRIYTDIVESDLLARIRNGIVGKQVSLVKNDEIYRLMLARHLANQMTQLLYVPADLMTYFAYRYDERGIGVSLLNGSRYINTLRALLLVSKVANQVRNAVGTTNVEIKLDPEDGDPSSQIELAIHEFMKLRQSNFPVGISTPGDLSDWVSKAGYSFHFTGHPGLPDMDVQTTEGSRSYTLPDSDLEDELRKRNIMTLGLSPESVDNGFSGEFATSIVANNLLLAKRVMDIQEVMLPQLTDHMRKVAMNDGNLVQQLKDIIRENYDQLFSDISDKDDLNKYKENTTVVVQLVISEFLSNFEATLPQPDAGTIINQSEAFERHMEAVDKAIAYYLSSESFTAEFGGEANTRADEVKNILTAYFARKWMTENNYLPEIASTFNELTDMNKEDTSILIDDLTNHTNHTTRLIVRMLKKTKSVANAADNDIGKMTNGEGLDDSSVSSDIPSGGGDDGYDDLQSGMDFNGSLDGGDLTTPEDAINAETSEKVTKTTETKTESSDKNTGELPPLDSIE